MFKQEWNGCYREQNTVTVKNSIYFEWRDSSIHLCYHIILTSEEVEDMQRDKIKEIGEGKPSISKSEIKPMRSDDAIGMAFSV